LIKDLLVNLSGRGPQDFVTNYAVSVGATFGAHLVGVAFVYDPVIPDGAFAGVPVDLIELQREENSKSARAAAERFAASAKAAAVSAETHVLDATIGGAATLFGSLARRFDLVVTGQAQREHGASEQLLIEAALFESGRPLLLVPYIQRGGVKLDRVIVGWDGSRTAARALADAIPFLDRAKAVDVVVIAEERKQEEIAGASIIQHLARHGVHATAKRMTRGDISIENVILSYAADAGADFLVMGGYGHSRLREFILGGVTRGILASMTLPVLMSH
jgi:nucleotide-binding universal stress UspA family protein